MTKFAGLAIPVDRPSRMTILHPATGEPLADARGEPAWIDLLSPDSRAGKAHLRATVDSRVRRKARTLTAEEMEREETELFAALTAGWRLLTLAGEPLEVDCSAAHAAELYALPELSWLRRQVKAHVDAEGNFLRT